MSVGVEVCRALSELAVEACEIVVHHAAHGIVWCDEVHRILHRLYPSVRERLIPTVEVERDDLLLEHVVDGRSVELVLKSLVGKGTFVGQRPAGTLTIAFIPPAVEDGEVKHAVHFGLLSRGARRL